MRLMLIPLAILGLVSTGVRAEEVVVIGGGANQELALKAINDFKGKDSARVKPAKGYPKILSADDLPGTPPDTYVAVLGFCKDEDHSHTVRMIQSITSGAYSKQVEGEHADACPTLAPELEKKPTKKRSRPGNP
jgi:hypothetical protein